MGASRPRARAGCCACARRASEEAPRRVRLAGIGIGVKDIIATSDQPTQLGSPIFAGAQPAFDAECVLRLKQAGGFALGKTVTTEFAFMQPGKTRNPWNASHTPGGSSSGRRRRWRSVMFARRWVRKPTVRSFARGLLRCRRLQTDQGRVVV
jgi:Asp-tRNA(Asn)/Glu-tRNA(Gln) amidotransferase A subunit family amidase